MKLWQPGVLGGPCRSLTGPPGWGRESTRTETVKLLACTASYLSLYSPEQWSDSTNSAHGLDCITDIYMKTEVLTDNVDGEAVYVLHLTSCPTDCPHWLQHNTNTPQVRAGSKGRAKYYNTSNIN